MIAFFLQGDTSWLQEQDSHLNHFSTGVVGGLAGLSLWLAPRSYRTPLAVFLGIRSLGDHEPHHVADRLVW